MARVLVLGVKKYDFTDENDRTVKGNNMYLIDFSAEDNSEGFVPIKMAINDEIYKKMSELPAYYEVNYALSSGSGGKAKVSISGVKFIEKLSVKQ